MPFVPFQNLIPKAAANYGIAKEQKAIQICREFEKILPGLFENVQAQDIVANIRAKFYKGNTLFVSVPSSIWASEVMMRKHKILEDLSKKFRGRFGRPLVKDLKTLSRPF